MRRAADLLERLPVAVARLDRQHRVVDANAHLARSVGVTIDILIGARCQDVLSPFDEEGWERAIDACFATGREQRVTQVLELADGEWLVDYRIVADEDPDLVVAVGLANLQATRLRELLDSRERLLRLFLDHAPVFAWLRGSEDHIYRMVNQTYLDHYGLERDEIIGRTVQERWPGPVADAFVKNDAEVARTGRAGHFYETAPDPDGTTHEFLNVKFPFRSDEGQTMIGSVAMDVTDHERRKRRLARLEQTHDIATLTLGAAHDLASDLMIIQEAALGLLQRPEKPTADQAWAVLAATERAITRLQDLRDPEDAATGAEPCDLEAVVSEVMGAMSERFALGLSYSGPAEVGVAMHPDEVRRIFENLVRNAAEAGSSRVHIEIPAQSEGGVVRVRVEDDGPGIADELGEQVFDLLVTTKGRGRGLGLAGVRALLRRRGGDIDLVSSDTSGACFEICFPRLGV